MSNFGVPNYCRLCLNVKNRLTDIFEEGEEIYQYIKLFFSVKIAKNDPYSTSICQTCIDFIIAIIRQRVKFRENDKILRTNHHVVIPHTEEVILPNIETEKPATPKRRPNIHPSLKKIFTTYENIRIPRQSWRFNYNAAVVLNKHPEPWPRKFLEKGKKKKPPGGKFKSYKDPTFNCPASWRKSTGENITNPNETDLNVSDETSVVKKSKRANKFPERFGESIFYEQFGVDSLDDILPAEAQCESLVYNTRHSRPEFETDEIYEIDPLALPNNRLSPAQDNPLNSIDNMSVNLIWNENPTAQFTVKIKRKRGRPPKFLSKLTATSLNAAKSSNNKFQEDNGDPFIVKYNSEETYPDPVHCSEDSWNRFFNNHYEQPELPNTTNYLGEETTPNESLLLVTGPERPVFLCHFCEQVFDNEKSRRRHILNHENSHLNKLQNNYENGQVLNLQNVEVHPKKHIKPLMLNGITSVTA